MRKRRTQNPKRKMRDAPMTDEEIAQLGELAMRVDYVGNQEHKRDP